MLTLIDVKNTVARPIKSAYRQILKVPPHLQAILQKLNAKKPQLAKVETIYRQYGARVCLRIIDTAIRKQFSTRRMWRCFTLLSHTMPVADKYGVNAMVDFIMDSDEDTQDAYNLAFLIIPNHPETFEAYKSTVRQIRPWSKALSDLMSEWTEESGLLALDWEQLISTHLSNNGGRVDRANLLEEIDKARESDICISGMYQIVPKVAQRFGFDAFMESKRPPVEQTHSPAILENAENLFEVLCLATFIFQIKPPHLHFALAHAHALAGAVLRDYFTQSCPENLLDKIVLIATSKLHGFVMEDLLHTTFLTPPQMEVVVKTLERFLNAAAILEHIEYSDREMFLLQVGQAGEKSDEVFELGWQLGEAKLSPTPALMADLLSCDSQNRSARLAYYQMVRTQILAGGFDPQDPIHREVGYAVYQDKTLVGPIEKYRGYTFYQSIALSLSPILIAFETLSPSDRTIFCQHILPASDLGADRFESTLLLHASGLPPTPGLVADLTAVNSPARSDRIAYYLKVKDEILEGKFNPADLIHREIGYMLFRERARTNGCSDKYYTYPFYLSVFEHGSAQVFDNDSSKIASPSHLAAYALFAGYELLCLYQDIITATKNPAGRPVLVIGNKSFGAELIRVLEPELQSKVRITYAKVGSSECHSEPYYFDPQLLDEETLDFIRREQPHIMIVDASPNDKYPDAHQGYYNYAIALSLAWAGQQGASSLRPIKGELHAQKLHSDPAVEAFIRQHRAQDTSTMQPYRFEFCNPAMLTLNVNANHQPIGTVPSFDPANLTDEPTVIFYDAVMPHTALPIAVRKLHPDKKHIPGIFDDIYAMRQLTIEMTPYGPDIKLDKLRAIMRNGFERAQQLFKQKPGGRAYCFPFDPTLVTALDKLFLAAPAIGHHMRKRIYQRACYGYHRPVSDQAEKATLIDQLNVSFSAKSLPVRAVDGGRFIDIIQADINKRTAVEHFAKLINLPIEEIAVFGDQPQGNDAEMLACERGHVVNGPRDVLALLLQEDADAYVFDIDGTVDDDAAVFTIIKQRLEAGKKVLFATGKGDATNAVNRFSLMSLSPTAWENLYISLFNGAVFLDQSEYIPEMTADPPLPVFIPSHRVYARCA